MDDPRVAPDGSPVDIYLALPAGEAPTVIHEAIPPDASILELGSGPGRITRVLVAYGHTVTAVDDSAAMLAHVTGARTVRSDLWTLDLPERFDAVVAGSHLVNAADEHDVVRLLRVCHAHLAPRGTVLVERYPPGFLRDTVDRAATSGPVAIAYERRSEDDGVYTARVSYRLGTREWVQDFETADVTDADLERLAAAADLHVVRYLGHDRTWAQLAAIG